MSDKKPTKICTTCGIEKSLDDFGNDSRDKKRGGLGKRSECKDCRHKWHIDHLDLEKSRSKIYRANNKEKIKEDHKKYYIENKEEISKKHNEYYIGHREEILLKNKEYRIANPEKIKLRSKKYYETHKEEDNKRSVEYARLHPDMRKATQAKYRVTHKEEIHEYYLNNIEYIKIVNFIYRFLHKKEISERDKKYRDEHREELREKGRQYYIQNREKLLKSCADYQKTPKGKANSARSGHRRRSREKNTEATLTAKQWNEILEMQNNRCAAFGCGKEFTEENPPTKDHIIPVRYGGSLTFGNTQALCKSCNSSKNDNVEFMKAIDRIILGDFYEDPE